jgi:hypothetical protein
VQEGFFQVVEGGQFLLVEGFEALDSGFVHYDFTASGCFGGS